MKHQSSEKEWASIVISSYNYAEYLPLAIDSALGQTYRPLEVIVADDESTDRSREVILGYGGIITPILKENGGQASAWNAGFSASRGDVVIFLDSDDLLEPTAVEKAMEAMKDPETSKVQWPAWEIDSDGKMIGEPWERKFEEGDLRERVLKEGPYGYAWPPSSQNAWRRSFLDRVMPMPEKEFTTCPDLFLAGHAPIYGKVRTINQPLSRWRMHHQNNSWRDTFENRVRGGMERDRVCADSMARHFERTGVKADRRKWDGFLWWGQIYRAMEDIERLIPAGASFMLADQEEWGSGETIFGRRRVPFKEREGVYWGYPETEEEAVEEIERQRQKGVGYIAFVWPHLWRVEGESGLKDYLERHYRKAEENDRVILFDLSERRP